MMSLALPSQLGQLTKPPVAEETCSEGPVWETTTGGNLCHLFFCRGCLDLEGGATTGGFDVFAAFFAASSFKNLLITKGRVTFPG